ncbi:hypothetical protein F2P81_016257 [Scophthalmus maximus]|uniref:Uncharacterized protein n=1 Tax=Scophthalmus maximus TaxID=52904 RepID=A0A6A4SN41_SCOMX|nr:hypothetical protein F2P81_016257 [Scophthalmus maximus]
MMDPLNTVVKVSKFRNGPTGPTGPVTCRGDPEMDPLDPGPLDQDALDLELQLLRQVAQALVDNPAEDGLLEVLAEDFPDYIPSDEEEESEGDGQQLMESDEEDESEEDGQQLMESDEEDESEEDGQQLMESVEEDESEEDGQQLMESDEEDESEEEFWGDYVSVDSGYCSLSDHEEE